MRLDLFIAVAAVAGVACDEAARPIRLAPGVLGCGHDQGGTVALFPFEDRPGEPVRDLLLRHTGQLVGAVTRVDGPPGCGQALSFPAGMPDEMSFPHLQIPDAPDWQLDEGAIDFWFRPRACAEAEAGVVTRDAKFQERGGHLRVLWRSDCRLAVRMQASAPGGVLAEGETATNSEIVTVEPLVPGRWTHFGVSFGPPGFELWVNGRRAGVSAFAGGLRGNENPFTVGASNDASAEGQGEPLWKPLRDADIDHLRISNRRLDFAP